MLSSQHGIPHWQQHAKGCPQREVTLWHSVVTLCHNCKFTNHNHMRTKKKKSELGKNESRREKLWIYYKTALKITTLQICSQVTTKLQPRTYYSLHYASLASSYHLSMNYTHQWRQRLTVTLCSDRPWDAHKPHHAVQVRIAKVWWQAIMTCHSRVTPCRWALSHCSDRPWHVTGKWQVTPCKWLR